MSKLRRYFKEGDYCFITCVTYERRPILADNIDILRKSFDSAISFAEAELIAWVVLPDHFHALIHSGTTTVTKIVHRLKLSFSANFRKRRHLPSGRVWQNRFWDHIIRNQDDLSRHIDYIHINPVKHGLVRSPKEYVHSSFNDYVLNGYYDSDWCIIDVKQLERDYGE